MSEMKKPIATRESYGNALTELGAVNENVLVLDADLSKSTKTEVFLKKYPERFINAGIAEGNMMSVAAGLATCGKVVFASSFAMFAAGRAFEQIRNSIGYPNLNVKIGATHAGVSVGEDGATHQCLEDIGIMRTIPNMVIINPADDVEARLAVKAAAEHNGPVYLRFGRLPVPVIYDEATYKFEIGKGVLLADGSDVTLIGTGLMIGAALEARELLAADGISARVINIHTIKPIDADIITKAAKETGAIVTAEEHNVLGGLGSAVCEVVAANHPVPVTRIGTQDVFGRSGKPNELLKMYGLTAEDIAKQAKAAIAMKNK
ncbi:MAG: transketolase family protein [Oscillospiraceae bacterium]|nr:transketolase family protein [Oscillospiraceae bacterium]